MYLKVFFLLILACSLLQCGEANVFSPTYGKNDLQSYEAALDLAEIYYDKGDHEQATAYAMKAYEQNPHSERAATVLAYSIMGMTGLDPIAMTKALNKKEEAPPEGEEAVKKNASNVSGFVSLQQILGIDQEIIESLGSFDDKEAEFPLLLPLCAEEARLQIETITLIDNALAVLCPFVDPNIKLENDYRHACEAIDLEVQAPGKVHFVWGLAHLAEGIFFNAALSYKSPTADADVANNLEMRTRQVQNISTDSPQGMKEAMSAFKGLDQSMSVLFDFEGTCAQSMLKGNFNDLMAVNQAFLAIAGLPKNILKPIDKAIKSLESAVQNRPENGSSVDASSLQAVLTKKIEGDLQEKIDAMAASENASAEDIEEACTLYESMLPQGAAPEACE